MVPANIFCTTAFGKRDVSKLRRVSAVKVGKGPSGTVRNENGREYLLEVRSRFLALICIVLCRLCLCDIMVS